MDVLVCMYASFSTFLLFQCNFAATAAQSHSKLLRRNSRPSHGGIKARLMQPQNAADAAKDLFTTSRFRFVDKSPGTSPKKQQRTRHKKL